MIIKPSAIAAKFVLEIKESIRKSAKTPSLVSFLCNDDPAAAMYSEWTKQSCLAVGIKFEARKIPRVELEQALVHSNADSSIDGVMVYYPVFGAVQDAYLQSTIDINKDVEALCPKARFDMYHNNREYIHLGKTKKALLPCTPLAVVKVLEHIGVYNEVLPHGKRLHGKIITVVNRSEVVGRPLAALLANDGAQVYSADEFGLMRFDRGDGLNLNFHHAYDTKITLDEALSLSDVVITGVPSPNYKLPADKLKEGVCAINFSTYANMGKDIQDKSSIFVGSVGKITVCMLQRNLLRLIL